MDKVDTIEVPKELSPSEPVVSGTTPAQLSPEDQLNQLALFFKMYHPIFKEKLKDLSTGQLRRLAAALVKYPIENSDEIDRTDTTLTDAFNTGHRLLETKYIMIFSAIENHQQKGLEQPSSETDSVPENNNENPQDSIEGENNNGKI